jgi:hypothetical protein
MECCASAMRRLARTSRWLIAAGATRNAAAMRSAERPSTVCSISGVRAAASISGWAQANMQFEPPVGERTRTPSPPPAPRRRARDGASPSAAVRARRAASISLRLAAANSQPSGLFGAPVARPGRERRREGVGERVFGGGDVARARS